MPSACVHRAARSALPASPLARPFAKFVKVQFEKGPMGTDRAEILEKHQPEQLGCWRGRGQETRHVPAGRASPSGLRVPELQSRDLGVTGSDKDVSSAAPQSLTFG